MQIMLMSCCRSQKVVIFREGGGVGMQPCIYMYMYLIRNSQINNSSGLRNDFVIAT